jgi:hypothetical protein
MWSLSSMEMRGDSFHPPVARPGPASLRLTLLTLAGILGAIPATRAASLVWTNAAGGNWGVATNWSPNQVPAPGDAAQITQGGNYTVTLDVPATVGGLVLSNSGAALSLPAGKALTVANGLNFSTGAINGPGALILGGTNSWSSGVLNAPGTITNLAGSTLSITTATDHNLPGWLLANYGTVVHTGGRVRQGSSGSIYNAGLWLEQLDTDLNNDYGGGASTFVNAGTFRKTAAGGSTRFYNGLALNNSGTVDAESGTIEMDSGGLSSGTFNAGSNAVCAFNSNYTFNQGSAFTGAGATYLAGGTMTFNGGIITSNLQWGAATLAGTLTISNGHTFTITGASDHNMPGMTFTNAGLVVHTGGRVRQGSSGWTENDGVWLEEVDADLNNDYGGGLSTFANAGTFRKIAGSGSSRFINGLLLNNSGLVDVRSGTVEADAGGFNTGIFSAVSNSVCSFGGGTTTFLDGSTFNGAGSTYLAGGTVALNGNITCSSLVFSGATITGSNTLNGTLAWNSGQWSGMERQPYRATRCAP